MLAMWRIWGSWLTSGKQGEILPSLLLGDHNSQSDVPCDTPCWRKMAEIWDKSCGVLGVLLSAVPAQKLLSFRIISFCLRVDITGNVQKWQINLQQPLDCWSLLWISNAPQIQLWQCRFSEALILFLPFQFLRRKQIHLV